MDGGCLSECLGVGWSFISWGKKTPKSCACNVLLIQKNGGGGGDEGEIAQKKGRERLKCWNVCPPPQITQMLNIIPKKKIATVHKTLKEGGIGELYWSDFLQGVQT